MAELPKERLQESPPFTYVGLDMFGPFIVKRGWAEVKRYGKSPWRHLGETNKISTCYSYLSAKVSPSCADRWISTNDKMAKVGGILNCRPLTVEAISDVNSLQPLTPSMLLTQKMKVIMPPPGSFSSIDTYNRKQWKRTQHLVQEFWSWWRKEFLATLQEREKWKKHRRNLQIGDMILLKEEIGQVNRPMGRVTEVFPDN